MRFCRNAHTTPTPNPHPEPLFFKGAVVTEYEIGLLKCRP